MDWLQAKIRRRRALVMLGGCAGAALCGEPVVGAVGTAPAQPTPGNAGVPSPQPPVSGYLMKYRLADGWERWPADKRQGIVEAMDRAVGLYNQLGQFPKNVTAEYNPGVPTADGSYSGYIRFGGQIGFRVALHELGHVVGCGTHANWEKFAVNGRWTGPCALSQLRAFDGPDAVLSCDHMHFWPYGLNYDSEASPENMRRHVLMLAALRRDMGMTTGEPFRGMVGVGTWNTQAEFRNIQVSRGSQVLFRSSALSEDSRWKMPRGQWKMSGGTLSQAGAEQPALALIGDRNWSDYTLRLEARKVTGKEGFLIVFGSPGDTTATWWNLGGFDNTRHSVEAPDTNSTTIPGRIETDRWYAVRLEVYGSTVRCFLDDKLVQEAAR